MHATRAIMARELVARREMLLVAVAAAVIASAMPWMPGLEGYTPDDVRTVSSNGLAVSLGWGLSLLLGATVVGRDLSENRLGFFFARPVSGLAVWWGRMSAALILIWAVEVIVLLPSFFGGGIYVFASWFGGGWAAVLGFVAMPVLLIPLAHAVSVMVRARTAWVFLDLTGCVVAGVAVWLIVRSFWWMGAMIALWVVGGGVFVTIVVALAVAGAAGLAMGRTELRRTHGVLSVVLWGTLTLGLSAVVAYADWLKDFEPESFVRVDVLSIAPTGEWVEVLGGAPGHLDVSLRCLISTTDDRWLLLPGGWGSFPKEVVFSLDGSVAVLLGAAPREGTRTLWRADLDSESPKVAPTTLVFHTEVVTDLSPNGRRVAVLDKQVLSVYALEEEKLLTAVRLPEDLQNSTPFFYLPDSIRLYSWPSGGGKGALHIAEIDAITGAIDRIGEIEGVSEKSWAAFDPHLEYLVLMSRKDDFDTPARVLYDARSGENVRSLVGSAEFLDDGRIVLRRRTGEDLELVVERPDGSEQSVHNLGSASDIWSGGEVAPGRLMILRSVDGAEVGEGRRADTLDLADGSWREVGRGMRRIHAGFQWRWGVKRGAFWYVNRPRANQLLTDTSGALVRWEPETGELVRIVGGRR